MKMRKFEVLDKDVTSVKLTVAKERTTLKVPLFVSPEDKSKLIDFAKYIESNLGDIEFTLRGRFYQWKAHWTIKMDFSGPNGTSNAPNLYFSSDNEKCKGMSFYTGE